MNAGQYQLAKALFHELSELPAIEWDAVLRAHDTVPEVESAVRELLSKSQEASAFDKTSLGALGREMLVSDAQAPQEQEISAESESLKARMNRLQSRSTATDTPRYRSEKPIGQGGMSEIVSVWDEDLRRKVAMKLGLSGGRAEVSNPQTASLVERFLREAQVTGQLSHPGIVPVYELGVDDDDRIYFTMQLVTGRTLHEIYDLVAAAQEGWSQTRALDVLVRVCDTMAYAHSKGIVHRDLKPANIMVGEFGEVYVMDWGVAKLLTESDSDVGPDQATDLAETMAGSVLGTPSYMSPEQAMGQQGEMSAQSDVYALGALLYEVLTGQVPYVATGERLDATTVLMRVRSGPPRPIEPLNPSVAPELVAICEKAMRRDSSARYPDATGLAEDLRAFLENRVVRAYATGPIAELGKWVRRNRAIAAAGLFALIALIGGLMASLAFYGEARDKEAQSRLRLDDLLDLSAISILEDLERRAHDLWPARLATATAMQTWIDEASKLKTQLPKLRTKLDALRATAHLTDDQPTRYVFVGDSELTAQEKEWQHKLRSSLVERMQKFVDGPTRRKEVAGLHGTSLAAIEERLSFSLSIADRTTLDPEPARLWDKVLADLRDDVRFEEIKTPVVGLVPLDKNPRTGLWEFWHVATGDRPKPRVDVSPGANRWDIGASTGMVMVLIPSGSYLMGCQLTDSDKPNYDPYPNRSDLPVSERSVSAMLVSKYEMTQAQWLYITGNRVSRFYAGRTWGGDMSTWSSPVERVSGREAINTLWTRGLRIPLESEWEYFTRAGTTTSWWTGSDPSSVMGAANTADKTMKSTGGAAAVHSDAWDDGYGIHAPVGSYRANPFGLHDVIGNVFEWCYDYRHSDVDSVRVDPEFGIMRGGDFFNSSIDGRSAFRAKMKLDDATPGTGVRPVLRRPW